MSCSGLLLVRGPMVKLADLIDSDLVILDLQSRTKAKVFDEMMEVMGTMEAREKMGQTGNPHQIFIIALLKLKLKKH